MVFSGMKTTKKVSEVTFALSEHSAKTSTLSISTKHDSHDKPDKFAITKKQSLQWIKACNTHFENKAQWDKKNNRNLIIFSILLTGCLYVIIFVALSSVLFKLLTDLTDAKWVKYLDLSRF